MRRINTMIRQATIADANPEDFLVYVNDTGGKTSIPTSEKLFYTCAHCKYILQDLNILSNVGDTKYEVIKNG